MKSIREEDAAYGESGHQRDADEEKNKTSSECVASETSGRCRSLRPINPGALYARESVEQRRGRLASIERGVPIYMCPYTPLRLYNPSA